MASINMSSLVRLAFLISGLVAGSHAHIMMNSPVPFGVATLNTSPLANAKPGSAGSDFPCKQRAGVYDITAMNNMAVGDTQELNFTGSASHGGGTCQVAVTMDLEPTVQSVWKIIQVFEGGCPISADGNAGTHPFTFEIPKGFPNGRATLSWTWYNRIGNREIYQNCAPITVTGGANDKTLYNSLPNWYIINLPTSECSSVETSDVIIPNPGQYVMKDPAGDKAATATGSACAASAAAQTSGVSGYQSAVVANLAAYSAPAKPGDVTGSPAGGAGANSPTGSSNAAGASATGSSNIPSASVTGSSPVPTATGSSAPQAPATTSVAYAATSAPASQASASAYSSLSVGPYDGVSGPATGASSAPASTNTAPTSSGTTGSTTGNGTGGSTGSTTGTSSGGSSTGTCTGSGGLVCNGPNQFGLCNNGAVIWQAVAPGTTCSNGQITRRSVLRDVRSRRRVQNAHLDQE